MRILYGLILISLCSLLLGGPALAQTDFLDEQFEVNRTNDIVYGTGAVQAPAPGEIDLLLDLYEPTGAGVPPLKPGFVIIHGRGSDKGNGKFVSWATDYAKRGYVCVSINYRIGEDDPIHTAGQDATNTINRAELLRLIQFFNSGGFGCEDGTEDGYAPGAPDQDCCPHDSDYNGGPSWTIDLSELLRLIQFFNSGGYTPCPADNTEDGYCPGAAS